MLLVRPRRLSSDSRRGRAPPLRLRPPRAATSTGEVCVLSIDGGARATDNLLAGAALVRLEAALPRRAGSSAARLANFFDAAAGSGAEVSW